MPRATLPTDQRRAEVAYPTDRTSTRTVCRRRFLRSAIAATAVASASLAKAGAPKEKKVLVGAHPWVYAARQPGHDITPILGRIFADMRHAGMDGIELMHTALLPDDAVERIGALSQEHRLPILGSSFGARMFDRAEHGRILEDAQMVITRLATLGGRTLGTSVGHPRARKTPEQLDAQADLLKKILAIAASHGVVVNLHNHTYEVVDDMHDLRGTLARVPGVKLGPDLNWLVRGGVDPVDFLRQYGDRIVFLHLRDQNADGTWSEALGEGQMDYAAIARALGDIGFAGDAVVELAHERNFKPTRPLLESLKMSRRFVRDTMGY